MTELFRARKDRGLPQVMTAKLARISQTALSGYERGERPVPASVAERLAKVLRVEIGTIFSASPKEVRR